MMEYITETIDLLGGVINTTVMFSQMAHGALSLTIDTGKHGPGLPGVRC